MALYALLLTQALRGDRVAAASESYVAAVFGDHFMTESEQELNMAAIVDGEVKVIRRVYRIL